jgi:hypothetical protein
MTNTKLRIENCNDSEHQRMTSYLLRTADEELEDEMLVAADGHPCYGLIDLPTPFDSTRWVTPNIWSWPGAALVPIARTLLTWGEERISFWFIERERENGGEWLLALLLRRWIVLCCFLFYVGRWIVPYANWTTSEVSTTCTSASDISTVIEQLSC